MSTASERAERRASWPALKTTLAEQLSPTAVLDGTAAWCAVLELTRQAYLLAGTSLSAPPRGEWPTRLIRPGDRRGDADDR